jgi:hypothetical protein
MHFRSALKSIVFALIGLPGCSLPRGPINLDPLAPHWLVHGEVSSDCPPVLDPQLGAPIDPGAIEPPVSKFHPVPTRPVFEPAGMAAPIPAAAPILTATR